MIQTIFDLQTGRIKTIEIPDPILTLSEAQQHQVTTITNAYENSIQVFQSSALGSVHTYLADDASMNKFNAEYTYVNSVVYDGSTINWYTVEQGGSTHTKDQFNQVWTDGRNYLTSMFNKWDSLVKKIYACPDVASVQAISW